jgi:2-C-methyl-D-erythritol 4-phosphate cytidylyltransferase/2-C-methyl-D-erythritol 2,4-cyclodiphosphate synthase
VKNSVSKAQTGVIIPAAGFGSRMQSETPKQFLQLAGEPILIRTIKSFLASENIHWVSLAIAADQHQQTDALLGKYIPAQDRPRIIVTEGGATRQQSVWAGLQALPEDVEIILVHDGARPLISSRLIENCLQGARTHGAVIAAIPVNDTIKEVSANQTISRTVDRTHLYQAQTPQAARRQLLEQAYRQAETDNFTGTDEASLLEHAGIPITIVNGEEHNIKITRPGDMIIARNLLGEQPMLRIGHGFDAHRLVENRPLILGGETIDFELGLLGHSDADVLTHAFIDALLGALGQGDIGKHFPDSDPRYKGINSLKLLEHTFSLVQEQGFTLANADLTILCQRPKLAPYLDAMRRNLASCCQTTEGSINIKATTTEEMGYTGRGEGIAAHGVVLLEKNG